MKLIDPLIIKQIKFMVHHLKRSLNCLNLPFIILLFYRNRLMHWVQCQPFILCGFQNQVLYNEGEGIIECDYCWVNGQNNL